MTNAAFNTETARMLEAADHVRTVNAAIQDELKRLMDTLEPLFAQWQGQASAQFGVVRERWNDNATKLNATLYAISEAIDKTRQNYEATEEANRSGFSGVAGKL